MSDTLNRNANRNAKGDKSDATVSQRAQAPYIHLHSADGGPRLYSAYDAPDFMRACGWELRTMRRFAPGLALLPALLCVRTAAAHSGEPLAPHDLWAAWAFEPGPVLLIGCLGLVYLQAVANLWHTAGPGHGVRRWQVAAFLGGLLLLAVALLPALLPLTLVKPHIGLPIALTRLTWRRALACAVFGLATFAIMPDWPLRWLRLVGGFNGYIPLLTLPGVLLLLALLRWRDLDARYLLLCAIIPQRALYDAPILAAALRTRTEMMVWVLVTWLYWPLVYIFGNSQEWVARLVTATAYVPLLALLLWRGRATSPAADTVMREPISPA